MIKKATVVYGLGTNPYVNLSLEHELLETLGANEIILYLWQNAQTVVIGRNQNAYKECHIQTLQKDGGHLARRLSGGGAVYHDLGNLNFTFIMPQKDYDLTRQTQVIVQAVKSFGLNAEQSGRNDITVDDKKFSGNAFYQSQGKAYHHGTLLINVDTGAMGKYLQVDQKKIESKGVNSVKSRVVNLQALNQGITVENMAKAMVTAFEKVYGLKIVEKKADENSLSLQDKIQKYSGNEWLFENPFPFTWRDHQRFAWGDLLLELQIEKEKIVKARAYSDAMDEALIRQIPGLLENTPLCAEVISQKLLPLKGQNQQMYEDLLSMLKKESFFKGE